MHDAFCRALGGGKLIAWRLDQARFASTWDSGEGAFQVGGRWNSKDVRESVVGAIAPAVEKAEIERAKRKPTESLDAYAPYLRGLARLFQFASRQANDEALRLLNSAIELTLILHLPTVVRRLATSMLRAIAGFQSHRARLPKS